MSVNLFYFLKSMTVCMLGTTINSISPVAHNCCFKHHSDQRLSQILYFNLYGPWQTLKK